MYRAESWAELEPITASASRTRVERSSSSIASSSPSARRRNCTTGASGVEAVSSEHWPSSHTAPEPTVFYVLVERLEESGLADPRLRAHHHELRLPSIGTCQRIDELLRTRVRVRTSGGRIGWQDVPRVRRRV